MANLPNGTIAVEYSRGQGAFFPTDSSIATTTTSSDSSGTVDSAATVATSFPDNPVSGQLCFRSDLGHLFLYTGSAWIQT